MKSKQNRIMFSRTNVTNESTKLINWNFITPPHLKSIKLQPAGVFIHRNFGWSGWIWSGEPISILSEPEHFTINGFDPEMPSLW